MAVVNSIASPGSLLDRRSILQAVLGRSPSQGRPIQSGQNTALNSPRSRIAHLLRRAGFGASKADLNHFEALGYEATVSWLLDFNSIFDPAEDRLAGLEFDFTKGEDLKRWWLIRMRYTTRPLQEKLTLFLHGLLTSGLSKVPPQFMRTQNELLRAQGMGSYRDLLVAVSRDPAMLLWLDGNNSRKQHPNENYARELMELFTIGIGNYSEDDVQEAARAFTGWRVNKETFQSSFFPRAYDNDVKTFMGHTGRLTDVQVIDIILGRRAAAEYLARRLWSFFAYPGPEPEVVGSLADTLSASGYNIGVALQHIFLSDAFSSARAYHSIIKSPVDLVVSTLRVLELDLPVLGLPYLTRIMGQDVFNPPNVAGWPGGPTWLNSALWLQRANFANSVATRRKGDPETVIELMGLMEREGLADLAGLRDYLVELLLDGQIGDESLAALNAYLGSSASARRTATVVNRKGRGLLYLLLASPEYQLL